MDLALECFEGLKTRVKLDLNYIENYSFLMDIRILIRTIGVILFPLDRGAY